VNEIDKAVLHQHAVRMQRVLEMATAALDAYDLNAYARVLSEGKELLAAMNKVHAPEIDDLRVGFIAALSDLDSGAEL
jgi:galactokinase